MKLFASAMTLLGALVLSAAARAEVVNVYTSANLAPLLMAGQGMYVDLVAHLNRQELGDLTFKLVYLPRKRLQVKLEEGSIDGIVIGMMPEWLDDTEQKKYLWTVPFALDRMVLVSRAARPVTLDTLPGSSVGVTLGYVYPGLDAWMLKYRPVLNNGVSDEKNLEKLLLGRLDSVLVGEAVARYFVKTHAAAQQLVITALPGRGSERRFMAPRSQAATFEILAPAIRKLKDDPAWQRTAASYY